MPRAIDQIPAALAPMSNTMSTGPTAVLRSIAAHMVATTCAPSAKSLPKTRSRRGAKIAIVMYRGHVIVMSHQVEMR